MRAGFAEIDITPPVGTHKIGWLRDVVSDKILDPLYARIAVFQNRDERIGLVQLDTLSVRWSTVQEIRRRVDAQHRFPGSHIMVAATHNHAGPAVANCGEVKRDEAYIETLTRKCVEAFGAALAGMQDCELGFNHVFEFGVGFNRRILMRDGTVQTQVQFKNTPGALCLEGPVDPEVAVLAARGRDGRPLGGLVNFACHAVHHGGTGELSAGYPGVLASRMKARGCPVTLFLNGASGNIIHCDFTSGRNLTKEEAGEKLAVAVVRAVEGMAFSPDWRLAAGTRIVTLPYREATEAEVAGTTRGAQRYIDSKIYDRGMSALLDRIRQRGAQPAEVQVLSVGHVSIAGIPAEYFVEHGLRIKRESHPRHALVAGHANGMVGYVPTREGCARGGYESTFAGSSRMAPEAGDLLADAAIALIKGVGI